MAFNHAFGDSDVPANEAAMRHVGALLEEVCPGAMATKFVLLVEVVDNDGVDFAAYTTPGLRRWDSMGMLQMGLALENTIRVSEEDGDGDGE